MRTNSFKSLALIAMAFVLIAVLSSCNRGYGCPTNFGLPNDSFVDAVQLVLNAIF
jgi:hypothetical protein